MVLSSEIFSSNWQVSLESCTVTLLVFWWISSFKSDSIESSEQVAGRQIPNLIAKPLFSGLIEDHNVFNCFQNKHFHLKADTYNNTPMRGLIFVSFEVCNMLGIFKLFVLLWFSCIGESPSTSITSFPMQNCVLYNSRSRWMWKHSEKPPNSKKFPSNTADGIFPQASITVKFYL